MENESFISLQLITRNLNNWLELRSHLTQINNTNAVHKNFIESLSTSCQQIPYVHRLVSEDLNGLGRILDLPRGPKRNMSNISGTFINDVSMIINKEMEHNFGINVKDLKIQTNVSKVIERNDKTNKLYDKELKVETNVSKIIERNDNSKKTEFLTLMYRESDDDVFYTPISVPLNITFVTHLLRENHYYEKYNKLISKLDFLVTQPEKPHGGDCEKIVLIVPEFTQLKNNKSFRGKYKTVPFRHEYLKVKNKMTKFIECNTIHVPKLRTKKPILEAVIADISAKSSAKPALREIESNNNNNNNNNNSHNNLNQTPKIEKKKRNRNKNNHYKNTKTTSAEVVEEEVLTRITIKQEYADIYRKLFKCDDKTKIKWKDFMDLMAEITKQTGGHIKPRGGSAKEFKIKFEDGSSKKFAVHADHDETSFMSLNKIRDFILPGLAHVGFDRNSITAKK